MKSVKSDFINEYARENLMLVLLGYDGVHITVAKNFNFITHIKIAHRG